MINKKIVQSRKKIIYLKLWSQVVPVYKEKLKVETFSVASAVSIAIWDWRDHLGVFSSNAKTNIMVNSAWWPTFLRDSLRIGDGSNRLRMLDATAVFRWVFWTLNVLKYYFECLNLLFYLEYFPLISVSIFLYKQLYN